MTAGTGRWRLLVGGTVGWLAFTVAYRVCSGRFWPWLLVELLPPLAFLGVPLLLLAGALLAGPRPAGPPRRAVVLGALAAALLGAQYLGLHVPRLTDRRPEHPGDIHVFAWNTEYWDTGDNPDAFYRYLTGQHADVYLLQEYLGWDRTAGGAGEARTAGEAGARQVDDLARLRRWFPGYQIADRGELLTLSRFPVVGDPPIGPDRTVAAGADFATVFAAAKVLRTDLDIAGRTVSFYNTHIPVQLDLSAGRRLLSSVHRRAGLRRAQFDGLAADLAANPNPVVVAGDFNTSPAMADLDGLRDRLHDAADAGTAPYPVSWPARSWPMLWRLDWTLTSGDIAAIGYRLRDPHGLSDHRAQDVTLRVTRR